MKKNIRRADLKDLETLFQLEREIFETPWSKDSIGEIIKSPTCTFLLYEREGEISGYLSWLKIFDELHILNVGVSPQYQGRGIGRELLQEATEYGDENGFSMTLEVKESNDRAQKLYRSFGFEVEGRRKNYYGQGLDALIMWRR